MAESSSRRSTKLRSKAASKKQGARRTGALDNSDGDAQVRAYISSLPPWQRAMVRSFDALMVKEVPQMKRAIKWGLPFYGVKDQGWIVSCGAFAGAVKITFFQGASLRPAPPSGAGKKQLRGIDLQSPADFDGKQLASWIRQAAKLPGMGS
jgi:hypothetical protein